MPKVGWVERKIAETEGFRVTVRHADGSDMRSDRDIPATYGPYQRRASDQMTVHEWKESRFRSRFVGYEVDVLLENGSPAHGRTLLTTVRGSYAR